MLHSTKKYQIQKSIEVLKSIFTDLVQYGEYHSLIKKVKLINQPNAEHQTYKIIEQPYKFLPFRISYYAKVKASAEEIIYVISGIPGTSATIHYSFVGNSESQTTITFDLYITSQLPGLRILQHKMLKAQDELMAAIDKK